MERIILKKYSLSIKKTFANKGQHVPNLIAYNIHPISLNRPLLKTIKKDEVETSPNQLKAQLTG